MAYALGCLFQGSALINDYQDFLMDILESYQHIVLPIFICFRNSSLILGLRVLAFHPGFDQFPEDEEKCMEELKGMKNCYG